MRRRPRPLRELDGTARRARLQLEEQIFRPPLRSLNLRLPPDQLLRIDTDRRVADSRGVLSGCAIIRELLDEALSFRQAMRPKSSGTGRGEPYPIDLTWPKDLLR